VQEANENKPFFEQDQYSSTLVENTPIGTTVTTVLAIDNDGVRNFAIQGKQKLIVA
jgi:hypothetical protein